MRTRRLGGQVIAKWAAAVVVLIASTTISMELRAAASGPPPSKFPAEFPIRWVVDPTKSNRATVVVSGLTPEMVRDLEKPGRTLDQWAKILAVRMFSDRLFENGAPTERRVFDPPILGSYRVEKGTLCFDPQFPLDRGVRYLASFRPDGLGGFYHTLDTSSSPASFQLPDAPPGTPTVVRQVYPSADVLPENLLKFYLHFSAPMRGGDIYRHIHLRNEAGKDIELPFLELGEELWNPAMTRLTLFIDPGRIKREVKPLEEIGPALEAGKRYTLVIDRAWTDANGQPLKESFRKPFKVGPPDRDPPDVKLWKLQPPQRGSSKPLVLSFPKPMDHALAQRMIRVVVPPGELVAGEAVLEDQERRWIFTPAQPWKAGPHTVLVQTTIEDLAGNNIGKAFEVDLFENVQRGLTNLTVKLPFEPKAD